MLSGYKTKIVILKTAACSVYLGGVYSVNASPCTIDPCDSPALVDRRHDIKGGNNQLSKPLPKNNLGTIKNMVASLVKAKEKCFDAVFLKSVTGATLRQNAGTLQEVPIELPLDSPEYYRAIAAVERGESSLAHRTTVVTEPKKKFTHHPGIESVSVFQHLNFKVLIIGLDQTVCALEMSDIMPILAKVNLSPVILGRDVPKPSESRGRHYANDFKRPIYKIYEYKIPDGTLRLSVLQCERPVVVQLQVRGREDDKYGKELDDQFIQAPRSRSWEILDLRPARRRDLTPQEHDNWF